VLISSDIQVLKLVTYTSYLKVKSEIIGRTVFIKWNLMQRGQTLLISYFSGCMLYFNVALLFGL
jgi:hypothetical protein